MRNMGEFLVLNANRYPDKTAIIYRDQRITFRELNQRVNRLAHHLLDLGVGKGDRVGFMLYNSNQFMEIFYAALKIGAIAVPLNFRMVPREVKWCLDHMECTLFAYSDAVARQVEPVKNEFSTVKHLIYSGKEAPSGEYHFETLTRDGLSTEPKVQVDFDDRAYIILTGGTTGVPKGGVHTHGSAIFGMLNMLMANRNVVDEVLISQIPFFHIGGIAQARMIPAIGGILVLLEKFDAQEILSLIEKERATWLVLLPPTTFIRLLDAPNFKDFDVTSVTKLTTSVGAFPKPLMLRFLDAFPNAGILYGYASTETGNGGTLEMFTRSMIENDLEILKSIGREQPLVQIRIVDHDGREVPVGETGEAIIKGPTNMKEYFEQPELTARTIRDGWVYTGDLLRKDKAGYFYFMGRNKDMIKTGGENVFAEEVEKVILNHPAVEMCAVIGLPDPQLSEAVVAVVKLREGFTTSEEEIIEHCKEVLSSYKKPRRVIFVATFPITDTGKVQKFKLREEYANLLESE